MVSKAFIVGGLAAVATPALAVLDPTSGLPIPTLTKDFHLECDLNPKLGLGSGPGDTLWNWISFTGGVWNATWGNGTIELGGHDYQYVLPELAAKLDTRYLLKTSDATPAYIQIKTDGWRTGPPEVLRDLNDPVKADSVDPSLYKFRLYINMNTGDPRYNHVNTTMWVASGMRKGAKVIYDAYQIG
ncbi:hypothetical protein QBC37DRAFT_326957 [Rhypophila decipiens]|uniref:Uncharacterized protein n=1 Tax=Rhypophila decipiens TaxID=261697 RepID=A0AAN6XVJ3_9PEZI|nr:hypothetical protein QBC37DRAFT_326957 [Rhypophila decipiens]